MVERDSYIDLVFRNGLKDLEALPPSDVWEGIQPALKKRGNSILLKAAAVVAVLMSLGIMAIAFSKQYALKLPNPAITFNQDAMPATDPFAGTISENQILYSITPEAKDLPAMKDLLNTSEYLDYKPIIQGDIIINKEIDVSLLAGKTADTEVIFIPVLENSGFTINKKSDRFELLTPGNNKIERWMLGALASPTYYLRYRPDKINLTTQLQNSEENVVTYSGGFSFSYSVNKKLSLQSGLYYSSMGNNVSGVDTYSGFQNFIYTKSSTNFGIATTNGTIIATNNDIYLYDNTGERISTAYTVDVFDPLKANLKYLNGSVRQSFQYLEIPVVVRYKLLDKKMDINLLGGVSYNFLVGNSVFAVYEGKHIPIGETEGINPIAFSSSLGLGMGYDFSKKITFNIEPTLRYYLSSTGNRTDGKNHPYVFGVYSGIFYKF